MNYILEIMRKPMIEQTPIDEVIGCLLIFGMVAFVLLIGRITYQIEEWYKRRKK